MVDNLNTTEVSTTVVAVLALTCPFETDHPHCKAIDSARLIGSGLGLGLGQGASIQPNSLLHLVGWERGFVAP